MADHTNEVSTSPMVTLGPTDNLKLVTDDGRNILLEGLEGPALLDHIAILPNAAGVWDKGGPMAGVLRSNHLPEELSTVPEGEAAMADALDKIDTSLGFLALRVSVLAHRRARSGWDNP
jgi:hypothetical protein